ncbi:MAG TPA: carboxypeptidase regulatory-like domain-containing protein [Bacillota bacterium]|nr:carboxypeptidase regulatory-like domain-containing protein [Bacillota bacterium]
MISKKTAAILTAIGLLLLPNAAAAHGVELSYETVQGIEITARYDSGEPMAGGQVTVYAPDNPADPWLTGTCDDAGKFFFTPDPEQPGWWEVQVRLAGHGDLIRIETGAGGGPAADGTGFTTLQKLVMVLAVAWGLAGTALFFSRRKS